MCINLDKFRYMDNLLIVFTLVKINKYIFTFARFKVLSIKIDRIIFSVWLGSCVKFFTLDMGTLFEFLGVNFDLNRLGDKMLG